jgi:hypothetical protein
VDAISASIVVSQLLSLVCVALGLAGMDRLRRFLKVTRPEIYESLKIPSWNWLRYNFDARGREQPNIRRLKGILTVHFAFAVVFWLAGLAARLGLLKDWLQ